MEWVEQYVTGLRRELGISGRPSELDLCRCVEYFPRVLLRSADVETAFCAHREDGGATIILPRRLAGRTWERALCHEMGHAVLTRGMHRVLSQCAEGDARMLRLARVWQWKEERIARAFASAWLADDTRSRR